MGKLGGWVALFVCLVAFQNCSGSGQRSRTASDASSFGTQASLFLNAGGALAGSELGKLNGSCRYHDAVAQDTGVLCGEWYGSSATSEQLRASCGSRGAFSADACEINNNMAGRCRAPAPGNPDAIVAFYLARVDGMDIIQYCETLAGSWEMF